MLERFDVRPPKRRLVGNVEADFYPSDPEAIRDLLCRQIASPVRWVEGVERLYAAGARAFVEVGPKRALKGFVDDVLADKTDITSLCTNRPRPKELAAFNQALAGLYAAGYGVRETASVAGGHGACRAPRVVRDVAPAGAPPRRRRQHARRAARAAHEDARLAAAAGARAGRRPVRPQRRSRRARSSSAAPASACPAPTSR